MSWTVVFKFLKISSWATALQKWSLIASFDAKFCNWTGDRVALANVWLCLCGAQLFCKDNWKFSQKDLFDNMYYMNYRWQELLLVEKELLWPVPILYPLLYLRPSKCLLSQLTLWVRIPLGRGVLDITLCDKFCQWLATGQWFSLGTLVSSINKKCPPLYNWIIVESGVKHHNPNPQNVCPFNQSFYDFLTIFDQVNCSKKY